MPLPSGYGIRDVGAAARKKRNPNASFPPSTSPPPSRGGEKNGDGPIFAACSALFAIGQKDENFLFGKMGTVLFLQPARLYPQLARKMRTSFLEKWGRSYFSIRVAPWKKWEKR
jgi:hypothetical protein